MKILKDVVHGSFTIRVKLLLLGLSLITAVNVYSQTVDIKCGDSVVNFEGSYAITRKVKTITEKGLYRLSNGYYYSREEIQAFINEYDGIKVGDKVRAIDTLYPSSPKTVKAITENGLYKLGGHYYPRAIIEKIDCITCH